MQWLWLYALVKAARIETRRGNAPAVAPTLKLRRSRDYQVWSGSAGRGKKNLATNFSQVAPGIRDGNSHQQTRTKRSILSFLIDLNTGTGKHFAKYKDLTVTSVKREQLLYHIGYRSAS
jgi:hypothetical protein